MTADRIFVKKITRDVTLDKEVPTGFRKQTDQDLNSRAGAEVCVLGMLLLRLS